MFTYRDLLDYTWVRKKVWARDIVNISALVKRYNTDIQHYRTLLDKNVE